MSIDQKYSEAISNPKLFALDDKRQQLQGNQLLKTLPAAGDAAGTITIAQNLSMNVTQI